MSDQPLTKEAATNRLLVATYEDRMENVANNLAVATDATMTPFDRREVMETAFGDLRVMLAKASAFKTVQANDKLAAMLTLAGEAGEKTDTMGISDLDIAKAEIERTNAAYGRVLDQRDAAVKRADEAEAALATETETRHACQIELKLRRHVIADLERSLATENAKRVDAEACMENVVQTLRRASATGEYKLMLGAEQELRVFLRKAAPQTE